MFIYWHDSGGTGDFESVEFGSKQTIGIVEGVWPTLG